MQSVISIPLNYIQIQCSGYGLSDRRIRIRFQAGVRNFCLLESVRLALGPTQPPMQWVPRDFLPRGVDRTEGEAVTLIFIWYLG